MEYCIRCGSLELGPPTAEDWPWLLHQLERPEIWSMFGHSGPSGPMVLRRHREGSVVLGIARQGQPAKRVGFALVFAPDTWNEAWDFCLAIPAIEDRGTGAAIDMSDAIGHYMFDHLRIEQAVLRIRRDNHASSGLARKLGFRKSSGWRREDGGWVDLYTITLGQWAARRAVRQADLHWPDDREQAVEPVADETTFGVVLS